MKNTTLTFLLSLALPALSHADEKTVEPLAKPAAAACCSEGTTRADALGGESLLAVLKAKDTKSTELCEKGEDCTEMITYAVSGMDCGACAAKITTELEKVEGIETVKVDAKTGTASFKTVEGKTVKPEAVTAAVKEAGFTAEGQLVSFKVNNMTCAGCSTSLTKTLASTEGVLEVKDVNHEDGTAQVVVDPAKTDLAKVAAAINETKFKVAE